MNRDLADLRNDYGNKPLLEEDMPQKPLELFNSWIDEALQTEVYEPTAMVLATIDENSFPDSRVVLLKGIIDEKLVFYTNYLSAKGIQMNANKKVSVVFLWAELHRQIRIQGIVEKSPAKESDQYFKSRPRESQLGARASIQSEPVKGRKSLEDSFNKENKNFTHTEIPRPEHWGGYRISPVKIEFWQGRTGRLHDRLVYTLEKGNWKYQRLAP